MIWVWLFLNGKKLRNEIIASGGANFVETWWFENHHVRGLWRVLAEHFPQLDNERASALGAKEEGSEGLFDDIRSKKTEEEKSPLSNFRSGDTLILYLCGGH